jgi:hypothetical protein
MEGKRTGSSDDTETSYSSSLLESLDRTFLLLDLGRETLSTNETGGTGFLDLRAMTVGTVTGVTSEALPIRENREPK